MRFRLQELVALTIGFALLGLTACTIDGGPDPDGEMLSALGLVAPSQVTDSVDADADPRDWREFSHFEAAEITVTYRIGDPSKGHGVRGVIEVYDVTGSKLDSKLVTPGRRNYALSFEVVPDKKYFIVFHAKKGAAKYLIDCQAAPSDPCGGCAEHEACEDGRCVPAACRPACERGEECVAGTCRDKSCPRGEYLHKRSGDCRPDPCYKHHCKGDKRCKIKRGKAVCVAPPRRGCDPPCGDGQVCKGSRCVDQPAEPAEPVEIKARILNYWEEDGKVVMLLNRGKEHGVKKGMKGLGGRVKVTEVYPYQCRARSSMSKSEMAGKKSLTLK